MSASTIAADAPPAAGGRIRRQFAGVLRLELRRQLFSRRAMVLYFLAFVPVALMGLWAITPFPERSLSLRSPGDAGALFAFIYTGYLGTSVFLSCLILFMSLFRAEILGRSLHYYFLTPVRREVIVVAKYAASLLAVAGVFAVATALLYLLTMSPWGLGELSRFLFQGPGLRNLLIYIGISMLGCVGYGALFLLAGLVFRNPIIVAVLFASWESLNFFLPGWLKKLSVFFYLWSLFPIQLPTGPFAILTEPTPALVSVPGLLVFTLLVLVMASWRARMMEITYGGED